LSLQWMWALCQLYICMYIMQSTAAIAIAINDNVRPTYSSLCHDLRYYFLPSPIGENSGNDLDTKLFVNMQIYFTHCAVLTVCPFGGSNPLDINSATVLDKFRCRRVLGCFETRPFCAQNLYLCWVEIGGFGPQGMGDLIALSVKPRIGNKEELGGRPVTLNLAKLCQDGDAVRRRGMS
jgi:hypothetical protein